MPFSDDMSLSIRDLLKTKTRRAVKGGFDPQGLDFVHIVEHEDPKLGHQAYFKDEKGRHLGIKCPYRPGDIMYVRETYYQTGRWAEVPGKKTKGGKEKWEFVPISEYVLFDAPPEGSFRKARNRKDPHSVTWHKRLGRFMPKKYARTWLEVVSVKVERLQDITDDDALKEGIEWKIKFPKEAPDERYYRDYEFNDRFAAGILFKARHSFKTLWRKINGKESWDANPWVWVIEFKVLSTTGRPDNLES